MNVAPTVVRGVRGTGPLLAAPTVVSHGVTSLTPWATAADVYFCKVCGGPRIFAKFVAGHIFLQNRDKINI
jgi:hypothetical protein